MKKILLFSLLVMGISFAASAQTDTTLTQYVGKYKFADGSPVTEITVSLENGALSMVSSVGTSPLEKQAEDVYSITQFQGTATFKRNENRKIIGVSVLAMGYTVEGTKDEAVTIASTVFFKR